VLEEELLPYFPDSGRGRPLTSSASSHLTTSLCIELAALEGTPLEWGLLAWRGRLWARLAHWVEEEDGWIPGTLCSRWFLCFGLPTESFSTLPPPFWNLSFHPFKLPGDMGCVGFFVLLFPLPIVVSIRNYFSKNPDLTSLLP
jgi:hypothetical protein